MELIDRISKDYMDAFKTRDMGRKTFLSVIKGEIENEKSRSSSPITDDKIVAILRKIEKSLKQVNTPESESELAYLNDYLPKLMGREDVTRILMGYRDGGVSGMANMMKRFNEEYKGLADNKLVSEIARTV